jgi:transmembrane sensor
MDERIVKHLRGEATEFEARQLERWRSESPANEREFEDAANLWWRLRELEGVHAPPAPSLDAIIRDAEARRRRSAGRAVRRAALRSPWAGYGLAAAAVAALVFIAIGDEGGGEAAGTSLSPVESSSGPGEIMTMSLSDGSVVRVAPDTRLEFPAASDRREVVLAGKAFFAVAEAEVPFVVRTEVGDVTVRGTRFEVLVDDGELRLVVVEGHVELGASGTVFPVQRGQVAYLSEGSSPRVIDREDVWDLLDWNGGLMLFQDTPLGQVAEEVERRFGRQVRIGDDALSRRRITAWFGDESLEEVISAVCLVAGVRCSVGESEVTIGR